MKLRLRTSLASLFLAAWTQAQVQSISVATALKPDLTHLQPSISSYSVWATGNNRTSKSTVRIQQSFIARSSSLTAIGVNLSGARSLRVSVLRENGSQIATAAMTAAGETAISSFSPAIALTPGDIYTVEFQNSGPATFYLSENEEAYVFSNAHAGGDLGRDVNMKVTGTRPFAPATPVPTTRALLILLDSGGVKLGSVKELKDAAPTATFYTRTCKFEDKSTRKSDDFIARIVENLENRREYADPAKRRPETVTPDFATDEVAMGIALAAAGTTRCKYDKVAMCRDGELTPNNVLTAIDQLAGHYVIDIHVLSRGGPNAIFGYDDQALTPANFFSKIEQRRAKGESISIRAVYQMNGFGGSLAAEWLAIGADVVNGTKADKLNMIPRQYFGFVKHWMNAEPFDQSVQKGYDEFKWYFDALYVNRPGNITDSRMYIHGNEHIRFK